MEMMVDHRAFTLTKLYIASHVYLIRRLIKEESKRNCWGCKHNQENKVTHLLNGCEDQWSDIVRRYYDVIANEVNPDKIEYLVKTLMTELYLPFMDKDFNITENYCPDIIYSFVMLSESLWPNLDGLFTLVYDKYDLKNLSESCTFDYDTLSTLL